MNVEKCLKCANFEVTARILKHFIRDTRHYPTKFQPFDPEATADINEIHIGAMKTGSFLAHLLCDVCRGFGTQNPEPLL